MIYINSIEDYREWKKNHTPVYLKSKKGDIEIACMNTVLIKRELIRPNSWNPNFVAKDKMELLEDSIKISGFCFPSVVYFDEDFGMFVISDGAHRYKMGGEDWFGFEYAPCVIRDFDENQRIVATVQFNKARGVHQVDLDADIIRSLIEQGMDEAEIADRFKIDLETVMRYKSLTGIRELFKNQIYSNSWSVMQKED
jgi:ParB-like chromosome segregation protein Spo0J